MGASHVMASSNFRPRILLPGFFIKQGRVGGAENFFYNLAIGLTLARARVEVCFFSPDQPSSEFLTAVEKYDELSIRYSGKVRSRFLAEQILALSSINDFDAIIFPNYFTPPFIRGRIRVATAVHDCQYKYLPEFFPYIKRLWLHTAHQLTVLRANPIVAISDAVARDIRRFYMFTGGTKIVSIGNPVSWDRFEQVSDKPRPTRRYILSVCHHYRHKNLSTLIRAFSLIADKYEDLDLILVGQVSTRLAGSLDKKSDNEQVIETVGLSDRIKITGFISDGELGHLYRNAELFAFPSTFEGFGMPPVEALGFGTPTITTRCGPIPKVTLGLARYVESPHDPREWAAAVEDILSEGKDREKSEKIAREIRSAYDLKKIGRRYIEALFPNSSVE